MEPETGYEMELELEEETAGEPDPLRLDEIHPRMSAEDRERARREIMRILRGRL